MAQTAAERSAARKNAREAAKAKPADPASLDAATQGKPPADVPAKPGPVLADYTLFGQITATPDNDYGALPGVVWLPLGEAKAPTHVAAMELAKDKLRDAILAASGDAPPVLKLTVAAIASRNWNQGTALVELRPVTTWEK